MTIRNHQPLRLATRLEIWQRALSLIWRVVPGLTIFWGILLVIQGLLPGATVYLTKLTIDSFLSVGENGSLSFQRTTLLLILTGTTLLLTETLQPITDWVRTAQAEYFSDHLKSKIFAKAAEVDLEFYESPEYHDLMEQARGESQSKPLELLESIGAVVQNAITLFSFAALLSVYGWTVPLLLIAGTLPGLLITLRFDRLYHGWWQRAASERRWLMYFESMLTHSQAAAEMRLFGLSGKFRRRYSGLRAKLRGEKLGNIRRQFYGKLAANILALAAFGFAIGLIALRIFNHAASIGDLAVFYQTFSRGQSLMRSFLGGVGRAINNSLYLQNLFAYLDIESGVASITEPVRFPAKISEGIRFKNVTFSYPSEERAAIQNFDLFIPAGKVVAVVGVNGAGKTTLIKLLCRFYDPQKGSIEIDGIDIRRFDIEELRRNISVLFQFPLQFHETVSESIALGNVDEMPDSCDIRSAAAAAGADSFIAGLPDNYETLLGKWFVNGCELSGGEWQRIALARAYFRRSPMIVLDEPTSFMDSWSEADWFDRFRELSENRTGLIITHRFTIAMRADRIYVLNDGRLIESGTHGNLVRANGFYSESWASQQRAAAQNGAGAEHALATAAV